MSRSKEEIQKQIDGLTKEKSIVPPVSLLGTKNHLIIDYQINTLTGQVQPYDIVEDDDDFEDKWDFSDVMEQVNLTKSWLEGETNKDLFDDYSSLE